MMEDVIFNGVQMTGDGGFIGMFTDRLTGSSFCVRAGCAIGEKLAETRARFAHQARAADQSTTIGGAECATQHRLP